MAFGFNVGNFNHLENEQIYDQIIGWAFSSSFMSSLKRTFIAG